MTALLVRENDLCPTNSYQVPVLIISSGKTKEELEKNVKAIVPPEKEEFVYLYQIMSK